ncbi:MAG: dihydropteroate synthase [Odoribacteraceae bacterium]|jgi:dihydropteroate synthase|nr:dihydropteroate synthase [Odoribacteraceae bacterium]
MKKFIDIDNQRISLDAPVVMGILNVTDDSFHDGGKYVSETQIIARVNEIVEQGAAIIDVGACSTRPGSVAASEEEEIGRAGFAVELIRKYHPRVPVSVDTFRASVVREICRCLGPVIVNDISGGAMDGEMFETVERLGLPYILCHAQGTPRDMQQAPRYDDVVREVRDFLGARAARLEATGLVQVIIDPGFGFGKTVAHNYRLLARLDSLVDLGYPVLAGLSRKSMACKVLDVAPRDALNATTALNAIALLKGASILRVHDVKEAAETVKIHRAMTESNP